MTAYQTNIISQFLDFLNKPRALPTLGPNRIRVLDAAAAIDAMREENASLLAEQNEENFKLAGENALLSKTLSRLTQKAREIHDLQCNGDDISADHWSDFNAIVLEAEALESL